MKFIFQIKRLLAVGALGGLFVAITLNVEASMKSERELRDVVGIAHVAGKYCLTEKDFLNEGADQILALGSRVIKIWFFSTTHEPPRVMYPFHSQWPEVKSLVEGAQLPYFKTLFDKPFTTYILTVASMGREAGYWRNGISAEQEKDETQQFYELAKFLLTKYANSGKIFILQHWEGDWLVRGNTNAQQDPAPQAFENMVRWLNARQAGVTKARKEMGEMGVKVYHAAEVNRVYASMKEGRPGVINRVIPRTHVDLVSYSAYDTMVDHRDNPQALRQALDFIAKNTPDHPEFGNKNVYVGEFGIPENDYSAQTQRSVVSNTVQTALDWGCVYIVYWQLYCNELIKTSTPVPVKKNEEVRGFWLLRPDGSKSEAWAYFYGLFKTAHSRQ